MSLYDFLQKQTTSYEKEQLRMMCNGQVCAGMKYVGGTTVKSHLDNLMAQNCILFYEHGLLHEDIRFLSSMC